MRATSHYYVQRTWVRRSCRRRRWRWCRIRPALSRSARSSFGAESRQEERGWMEGWWESLCDTFKAQKGRTEGIKKMDRDTIELVCTNVSATCGPAFMENWLQLQPFKVIAYQVDLTVHMILMNHLSVFMISSPTSFACLQTEVLQWVSITCCWCMSMSAHQTKSSHHRNET